MMHLGHLVDLRRSIVDRRPPKTLTNRSAQWNAVKIALHRLPDESIGVGSSSNSDRIFGNRAHVLELGELGEVGYSVRRQFRDGLVRGQAEYISWASFVNKLYRVHQQGFSLTER